jgi:hypothetical protein
MHGAISSILFPVHHGILYFMGFTVVEPFLVHAPVRITHEERVAHLTRYKECVLGLASAPTVAYLTPADYDVQLRFEIDARYLATTWKMNWCTRVKSTPSVQLNLTLNLSYQASVVSISRASSALPPIIQPPSAATAKSKVEACVTGCDALSALNVIRRELERRSQNTGSSNA